MSVHDALDKAEFATLKIVPHCHANGLVDLAQRFVLCLLFSVSEMISVSALSADFFDENGSFASTLLKSTKRLYGIAAKLMLSFMSNPQSLTSEEMKRFLDYLTSTLMQRISKLLSALLKKQETKDGKFLAESKIESHGRTSALLVFEKEKLDNALLKVINEIDCAPYFAVCALEPFFGKLLILHVAHHLPFKLGTKLKQAGLEKDSVWLEDHVVPILNRGFVIRKVEAAKNREAPKKTSSGAKRKVKSEPNGKKIKKEKRAKPKNEDENVSDNEGSDGSCAIQSVDAESVNDADDDDVVSLSRLTAEMEEDEDDDEEGEDDEEEEEEEEEEKEEDDISDSNDNEEESESEEEAEFDD